MGSGVLQIICNLAACVILLLLHVSENTSGFEPLCIVSIKVPRNTLFRAPVMTVLKINCTVNIVNCQRIPIISWCKLYGNDCKPLNQSNYIETEWKNITQHDGISFLTFINISMEDAGLYRCKEGQTTISHTINVTVTEDKNENEQSRNQSNTSEQNNNQKDGQPWPPYVYICSGIVGLVVIVITVSLFIIRCQGRKSTRKEMTANDKCVETQSRPSTPSHPHHSIHSPSAQLSSAVSYAYNTSPVIAESDRDHPPAGRISANTTEFKGCQNNVRTEEEQSLVYASLNYQAKPRRPKRTVQQETEHSEYAAIRFR